MPYKFQTDKIPMPRAFDKRIKLTEQDKLDIVDLYKQGNTSQRKLAAQFGISRRTIQFTLDPKKKEENLKRREERGDSKIYYNKEKHTESTRNHRRHKRDVLKDIEKEKKSEK